MTHPSLRGVVFDMDGLLLDSERLYFNAFRDAHVALGLPPNDALFLSMVGTNVTLSRQKLAAGLKGHVAIETFEARWAEDCAAHTARGIPVKEGVVELVTALQAKGVPYAIATSTYTGKAIRHLEHANLSTYFPLVIGGDQVSQSKPAPDIYLKACTTLALEPAHCVAFEDSENGVRAAHAAGLVTVQIPDLIPPPAPLLQLGHIVSPDLMAGARAVGLIG